MAQTSQNRRRTSGEAEKLLVNLVELKDRDDQSAGKRVEQAATIAAQLLATFGKVDSRLASFRERLTDAQDAIRQLSSRTHARVVAVAVGRHALSSVDGGRSNLPVAMGAQLLRMSAGFISVNSNPESTRFGGHVIVYDLACSRIDGETNEDSQLTASSDSS